MFNHSHFVSPKPIIRYDLVYRRFSLITDDVWHKNYKLEQVAIAIHCNVKASRYRASRSLVLVRFGQICTACEQKLLFRASGQNYGSTDRFGDPDFLRKSINLTSRRLLCVFSTVQIEYLPHSCFRCVWLDELEHVSHVMLFSALGWFFINFELGHIYPFLTYNILLLIRRAGADHPKPSDRAARGKRVLSRCKGGPKRALLAV